MKTIIALISLTISTFTFAESVFNELQNKKCQIDLASSIRLDESSGHLLIGNLYLIPLIEESSIYLSSGKHEIKEFDEEVIVLEQGKNMVFGCIIDDTQECVKLSQIESKQFDLLTKNEVRLNCE